MQTGFFFDIDGTLYQNRFHEVSDGTIDALRQLHQQGYPLYIATSRSIHELKNLPRALYNFPFRGWILEGGSLLLDEEHEPVYSKTLNADQVQIIKDFCHENYLTWRYSTLHGNYWGEKPTLDQRYLVNRLYLNCAVEQEWTRDCEESFNVLVWMKQGPKMEELMNKLSGCSFVCYPACLEIRQQGGSKEQGVQFFKDRYGLDQVICFGDGPNDASMLEQADIGIAMGNASQPAKEAADLVTKSIEEDGIAYILKEKGWIQ